MGGLFWLNIMAARHESVEGIVRAHWKRFGRNYYTRHDYEEVDSSAARGVMDTVRAQSATLPGRLLAGDRVTVADDFSYLDPVDGSVSDGQGLRILFASGARIVFRLSGTGTSGATLRVYVESHEDDPARQDRDPQEALAPYLTAALELSELPARTGRQSPTVVT